VRDDVESAAGLAAGLAGRLRGLNLPAWDGALGGMMLSFVVVV
jgi:hypothetical protein